MEIERTDQKKSIRTIRQRDNKSGESHILDNRSGGHRNYLSGAPLQRSEANEIGGLALQRKPSGALSKQGQESGVVQRTEYNDARKRFVYVSPADFANNINKQRIPYRNDTIHFTNYTPGTEILSAGFNGCFMMAFRFLRPSDIVTGFKLRELFQTFPPSRAGIFVAHVANNVKEAIQEAEYDNLISIEAIFRPYNMRTKGLLPSVRRGTSPLSIAQAGVDRITGGMRLVDGRWVGKVYRQERIPNPTDETHPTTFPDDRNAFEWDNGVGPALIYAPGGEMNLQTLATKAYIYARVNLDRTCSDMRRLDAYQRLVEIRNQNPLVIAYACIELVDQNYEQSVLNLMMPLSTISRNSIGEAADAAYRQAERITRGSEGAPTDHIDIGLVAGVANAIRILKRMRDVRSRAIVWAYAAAMHNGNREIMKCLKEFYEGWKG